MNSLTKTDLRHVALDRRKEQEHKDDLSDNILSSLTEQNLIAVSDNLLVYVSVRTEVRTWPLIDKRLEENLPVFIPYCEGNNLKIFRLQDSSQVARGAFGILEPKRKLQQHAEHHVTIDKIDSIIVPGVAFDPMGHRLGYGKGYFDRLLGDASNDLTKIGLAFDCQIFDSIPFEKHDVTMDFVVTESEIHRPAN